MYSSKETSLSFQWWNRPKTDVKKKHLYNVTSIEHNPIRLSDGVHLSARIWLPCHVNNNPAAAILEYIPYRKRDMVRVRDERNHVFFAQHGFASVRVDMRGSGDSEGYMEDMYGIRELSDAKEVIEWIAIQPWCNGQVGMMGTSWGGTSSLQTAIDKPKGLKAIIAVCATDNRFEDDIHFMGGCVLTDTVEWAATLPAILASPPDPENLGQNWREIWMQRLEKSRFPGENWLRHQIFDDYWQHGSVSQADKPFECPVLLVGGWRDRYSNTVINCLNRDISNCWGIVGPWGHHYPDQASPGPGISFQKAATRWWNHWLNGVENGVPQDPKLTVWVGSYDEPQDRVDRSSGYWTALQDWPCTENKTQTYYFVDRSLQSDPVDMNLSEVIPVDPTVGMAAGDTGYFGRVGGLPLDQQIDGERSLVFETDPIDEPIVLLGSVQLDLSIARDRRNTQIAVRICDVAPDGKVAQVGLAIRNLALVDDLKTPLQYSENDAYSYIIKFPNKAYRFEADHRLRISISGSYWPLVWPSPNFSRLTLYPDRCLLSIPIFPLEFATDGKLPEAESMHSLTDNHVIVADPVIERRIEVDSNGRSRLDSWRQPKRVIKFEEINLEFGTETDALHTIQTDDLTSAKSEFTHQLNFCRNEWIVEVSSKAELTSTEESFRLRGILKIRENGNLIFSREWNSVVPRKYG